MRNEVLYYPLGRKVEGGFRRGGIDMEFNVSVRLFISYAHEDEGMRKGLDPFLRPPVSEKLITV
jgi:hypothetical protein